MTYNGSYALVLTFLLLCTLNVEVKSTKRKKLVISNTESEFPITLQLLEKFWKEEPLHEKLKPSKNMFKEAGIIAAYRALEGGVIRVDSLVPTPSHPSLDIWMYETSICGNTSLTTKDLAAKEGLKDLIQHAICRKIQAELAVGCYQERGTWFIVYLFKGSWAYALNSISNTLNNSILGQMKQLQEYSTRMLSTDLQKFILNKSLLLYYFGIIEDKTSYIMLWSIEEPTNGIAGPNAMLDFVASSSGLKIFKGIEYTNTRKIYIDVLRLQSPTKTSIFGKEPKECVVIYLE